MERTLIAIEKGIKLLFTLLLLQCQSLIHSVVRKKSTHANVIKELIAAKYWDLLYVYYEKNQKIIDHSYYSKFIAEKGHVEGLKILRNLSITHRYVVKVACIAASHGKLEFWKNLMPLDC